MRSPALFRFSSFSTARNSNSAKRSDEVFPQYGIIARIVYAGEFVRDTKSRTTVTGIGLSDGDWAVKTPALETKTTAARISRSS
jgi:hypothetical protein